MTHPIPASAPRGRREAALFLVSDGAHRIAASSWTSPRRLGPRRRRVIPPRGDERCQPSAASGARIGWATALSRSRRLASRR